jgi:hypothetical protein
VVFCPEKYAVWAKRKREEVIAKAVKMSENPGNVPQLV